MQAETFKQAVSDADNLPKDDESLTDEISSDKNNIDHNHSLNEEDVFLYDI